MQMTVDFFHNEFKATERALWNELKRASEERDKWKLAIEEYESPEWKRHAELSYKSLDEYCGNLYFAINACYHVQPRHNEHEKTALTK